MSVDLGSLQLFFPIVPGGLSRQTFLNEVLTPQIQRGSTDSQRSALARILYDDHFEKSNVPGLPDDVYKRIISGRTNTKNRIFSIHPDHHQDFEEGYTPGKPSNPRLLKEHQEYLKFMSNVGSEELAAMTPYVKLIYRYKKKENDPWKEIVVPFQSFSTENEFNPHVKDGKTKILGGKFARGDGAGINSVTVNRKFPALGNLLSVNVDINFFFQNINVLTRKQIVDGQDFSFIKVMAFLAPKFEELVLEYGYGISRFTDPTIIPPKIQTQILLKEKKRFILRYKSHTFNFEQDGSIRLSTSYTTQQDQDLFNKSSDISIPKGDFVIGNFSSGESTKKLLRNYRDLVKSSNKIENKLRIFKVQSEKRKQAARMTGTSQNKNNLIKIEFKKKELENKLREQRRFLNKLKEQLGPLVKQTIVETIRNNKELFKINFEASSEKEGETRKFQIKTNMFLEEGQTAADSTLLGTNSFSISSADKFKDNIVFETIKGKTGDEALNVLDRTIGSIMNTPIGANRSESDKTFGDIGFFSLRALVAAAYENLEKDFKDKQAPFIGFGNIKTKAFGKDYSLNLGDILVSVDEFQKWYYRNYLSKNLIIYSFGDFLNDVMTDLVPKICNESSSSLFGRNHIGSIRPFFYLTKMTGNKKDAALFREIYKTNSKSKLKTFSSKLKTTDQTATRDNLRTVVLYTPLKSISSPTTSPYLLRNLSSITPPFDEAQDIRYNAPHVKIGADSGLLKNISFNAQDFPGLRTALWAESLVDSAEVLLKYRYSANVTTIGNNVFFKGGFFTVPANPLGISKDTFDPGIVGYYAIQNVTDSISIGSYETTLAGTWVFNPASQKGKSGTDVTQQNVEDLIPPIGLKLSVVQYLEDLFRLDASVLLSNGLNSDFSPSAKTSADQPPQNDLYKDIKEPI
tara:strand:- start:7766 stop:10504 length:2739 start_codon:yes stop_codon:yes gene_type:complete